MLEREIQQGNQTTIIQFKSDFHCFQLENKSIGLLHHWNAAAALDNIRLALVGNTSHHFAIARSAIEEIFDHTIHINHAAENVTRY